MKQGDIYDCKCIWYVISKKMNKKNASCKMGEAVIQEKNSEINPIINLEENIAQQNIVQENEV